MVVVIVGWLMVWLRLGSLVDNCEMNKYNNKNKKLIIKKKLLSRVVPIEGLVLIRQEIWVCVLFLRYG